MPAVQANSRTIPVTTPAGRYEVIVQQGLIETLGAALARLSKSKKVGIVTDANVKPLYAEQVESSLRSGGFETTVATLAAGESHKTLGELLPIYDTLLKAKLERSTPILALGGGIV